MVMAYIVMAYIVMVYVVMDICSPAKAVRMIASTVAVMVTVTLMATFPVTVTTKATGIYNGHT